MAEREPLRVAAVQMEPVLGAVEANCEAAERLARSAFARGARWVILPEFFATGMAFHPSLLDAAPPLDGPPARLLRSLAREHAGVVGGSFVATEGDEAYNCFLLAFPDGTTFRHDKDLPTMWENCWYAPGSDDGVLETPLFPVGAAMCWELVRTATARRLRGRVDLAVGGSCWWDLPEGPTGARWEALRARNREILAATPAAFARMLGTPFVHASCAGRFEGHAPGAPARPYRSRWLGEAQIVDALGRVLARRTCDEGEGVLVADVTPGHLAEPADPVPEGYWVPRFPRETLDAWEQQNAFGRAYYRDTTRPHRTRRRRPDGTRCTRAP